MARLFNLKPTKGIFMVNLVSPMVKVEVGRSIRVGEEQLVRVVPNMKSLRIELEYE